MKRYSIGFDYGRKETLVVGETVNLSQIFTMVEAPDGGYVKTTYAQALHEALTKLVECIEVIKHDRQDEGTEPDWFDWVFINQELKRSKEALGGGE